MRISDWSSDVCSSDLTSLRQIMDALPPQFQHCEQEKQDGAENLSNAPDQNEIIEIPAPPQAAKAQPYTKQIRKRSEEHTSELQSLMRHSYAVFCLKKKNIEKTKQKTNQQTTTTAQTKQ